MIFLGGTGRIMDFKGFGTFILKRDIQDKAFLRLFTFSLEKGRGWGLKGYDFQAIYIMSIE